MAGGMDLGGSGKGKRSLDTTINLVPFIDLMAVTIVFLILNAVWTQAGRLEVTQGTAGEGPRDPQSQVTLRISEAALTLLVDGVALEPVPLTRDEHGRVATTQLIHRLRALKQQAPEQTAITLSPDDTVRYDDLVRVLDTCVGERFPSVTVSSEAL